MNLPTMSSCLLIFVTLAAVARGESAPFLHSSSSSQYVHSNDTIQVRLPGEGQQQQQLYGPAGSVHELEFVVTNLFRGGHFSFE